MQDSVEELAEKAQVAQEKIECVLEKIQQFDPLGVGARSLQECLLLQIKLFGSERAELETLITHHLSALERRDYRRVGREMKLPPERVAHLAKIVQELEPKPGRPYFESSAEYITPDVYVYKVGEEWVILLNEDGMPRLQVSSFYRNMMQNIAGKNETKEYIQTKLKSALWFIKSIHQRQRTLYKVVRAIMKFQKDFFEKGINHLKPMILRDVAEEIEMHESTVSRVTTNKYLYTPRGIHELKYFFNNGVATSEGDFFASKTIKETIRQIVSKEDPCHPLSDQEIVEILKESKIEVARRTVAKYREMIGIFSSSKRKQLF
jgi:RNA polymerase sigma-54 factor